VLPSPGTTAAGVDDRTVDGVRRVTGHADADKPIPAGRGRMEQARAPAVIRHQYGLPAQTPASHAVIVILMGATASAHRSRAMGNCA